MLPSQFVERLKSMAKFRNLLVHLYWKVDDNKVFQILNEDMMVFDIDKNDIDLRGIIDHSMASSSGRYHYGPLVERSLYIEELLYTKSPTLLRINELDDLDSVKNVELEPDKSGKYKIY